MFNKAKSLLIQKLLFIFSNDNSRQLYYNVYYLCTFMYYYVYYIIN